MRKPLSILLLVLLSLPLLAPVLAQGGLADASLPACCRRTGKHHCAMTMGERDRLEAALPHGHGIRFEAPIEKCPYCPAATFASAHPDPFQLPETAEAIFAELVRHPAVFAQTESRRRIARDRSRQKRGPPSLILS